MVVWHLFIRKFKCKVAGYSLQYLQTFVFKTQGFSKSDPFLIATVEAGVGGI